MKKFRIILMRILPIFLMIGAIPLVTNDYVLAGIYIICIALLMFSRKEKHDWLALVLGLVAITISECFFVSTGVETFTRHSLFGLLPLWLPFLWAYVFVTIKRSLALLVK